MTHMTEQPTAIIYIDGEEFMRLWCDADSIEPSQMFEETKRQEPDWREVALMVWKPRYGIYLREKLSMR